MKYEPKHIVVVDNGFVFAGDMEINDGWLTISNARMIRVWGTKGVGLGHLAISGATSETVLDLMTDIKLPVGRLVFYMDVTSGPWKVQ